jgi:hypothetical protein
MTEYRSDELLFLTEPKVESYPYPHEVPKLAGKFMICGLALAHQQKYPHFYYLYPTGTWRENAVEDGFTAYYDTSLEAKKILLKTRIFRDPSCHRDADPAEIITRYT